MTNYVMVAASKNLLHLIAGLLLLCKVSTAQDTVMRVTAEHVLPQLPGFTQTIYYSPGFETRAKDIAAFIDNAGVYFQAELDFTPKTNLYVLAPDSWKLFAAKPLQDVYGFPHNVDHERLVIAAEDNAFWRSYLPVVNQLPSPLKEQVTKAYGRPDGSFSMMPFFDLLALHEMGHSYTAQAGLKMHRWWMNELFVNIMLHTYVAEKQPELLPALETFPNMVVSAGTADYQFTSLGDFEKLYATLGMGAKNYGWYQCKLHIAAKNIYNAAGSDVLKKLWNALKREKGSLSDSELIDMLKKDVHPSVADVFLNWDRLL